MGEHVGQIKTYRDNMIVKIDMVNMLEKKHLEVTRH